jgi:hypothetical protein
MGFNSAIKGLMNNEFLKVLNEPKAVLLHAAMLRKQQ